MRALRRGDAGGLYLHRGGGNVIRPKGLSLKAVYPKAALCPVCGEVSVYADEEQLEKLKK